LGNTFHLQNNTGDSIITINNAMALYKYTKTPIMHHAKMVFWLYGGDIGKIRNYWKYHIPGANILLEWSIFHVNDENIVTNKKELVYFDMKTNTIYDVEENDLIDKTVREIYYGSL
jgi:hypothetical protein